MPEPTTLEWAVAGSAAASVAVLSALLLVAPVMRASRATPWGRAAALLLATLATGLVLVVVVTLVAGWRASDSPSGPFVGVLVHEDVRTAERIGAYVAALLLPLAAVLAVLALAVVDVGRSSGFRIAAGIAAGAVLATGLLIALGDAGTAATGVGWAAALLAGAAAVALALDELRGGRPR